VISLVPWFTRISISVFVWNLYAFVTPIARNDIYCKLGYRDKLDYRQNRSDKLDYRVVIQLIILLHRRCFYEFRGCQFNVHIFLIFSRKYHINSQFFVNSMCIYFLIFSRKYHINSQIFVYAFAPSRVLFN